MTLELGRAAPCHLSFFNIYVRELGNVISNCAHGVKYAVVGKDGVMEWKSQAGLLYADDVCLMANTEKDLKVIMEKVNDCVVEYGLKVNEKKSKVVCINGKVGRRRWMMGDCCIGEIEEYKYLGITIEGGKHGGFKSMGDRMKESNGLIGMVKYAAERSGRKYVIGREGWKTMIVSKLMYGCGALAWYQRECDDLEVIQNGFGRWLWEVGNVRNELVRGESGWSSFAEREVKCIVDSV